MILFGKKQYKSKSLEELIHLAQQDDLNAVEEIVKRNQENIYASFYYLSNDCEDLLDLTQEALLKMARNIKKLKECNKIQSLVKPDSNKAFL